MTAIGVFGGTFAPIHHGHLRLAIELRERLQLDRIHLIPSGEPPHREAPAIGAQRRLQWVRLACAGVEGLEVDDREVRRSGRSFTHDTLAELRADFPDAALVLLLGDDAANQFHTWHRWEEIPGLAHIVFVERPYESSLLAPQTRRLLSGRRAEEAQALREQTHGRFLQAAVPPLAISSTRVRGLLRAGRSVHGLVPRPVIDSFTPEDIQLLTHDEDPALD